MASVTEALNAKPPLGAALAEGVRDLSNNQVISFDLYRKYVFPLDGLVYWIRVSPSAASVSVPGNQPTAALATAVVQRGIAVQVSPGGLGALRLSGGTIINPLDAMDQGIATAESLFVDPTNVASIHATATTVELEPGDSYEIPPNTAVWANAATDGHQFTAILYKSVDSVDLPTNIQVQGSLHYDAMIEQAENRTVDSSTVVFTALSEIQAFNNIGPDYLYIATYRNIRFAFSSRGRLYEQADLYHYVGKTIYSTSLTQVIEDANAFNPTLVVSNSLPIWLNMINYIPPYAGFTCPIVLYPSYLVEDNLPPPFGSVHIEETTGLATSPHFGPNLEQWQLCRDKVIVHTYGGDHNMISTFLAFVEQYSYDNWKLLGMANIPVIKDVKESQPELRILAQRKRIEFDVNYNQYLARGVANDMIGLARQLIKRAMTSITMKALTY